MKLAYVMSRFPRVTETFVLQEIVELIRRGFDVELFPLLRERGSVRHPEVAQLLPRAHGGRLLSWSVARANWSAFWGAPVRYARLVARVARGTFGSANHFFGGLAILPEAVCFAREMQARGTQHVHAHFANHPALCAWIVREWTGIPFSFTAHGSDIHVDQRGFEFKLEGAEFAVTVSRYNVEFLRARFGAAIAEKLQLIHCGIDPDVFRPGARGATEDELRLVCVASFRRVKGHAVLVDGCRLLAERGIRFRCDLIGDGPEREAIERQVARAGLEDSVHLHGARPRPEVLEWVQAADVACLTSVRDAHGRREGIPVSLMEAMACGVPVVASRISGIPELVDHEWSGLLFPPGDAAALADAVEELAGARDRRVLMGRAAREKVREEFDLRANTGRLADLFLASEET